MVLLEIFGIGPKIYLRRLMKVVTIGTYSQAGLAALANATYEQRRAISVNSMTWLGIIIL